MSAERRYFEEEEHVALYAASRPTVPHSLLQDIIQYCNRIAQSLIYINMNFFSKLHFFSLSTAEYLPSQNYDFLFIADVQLSAMGQLSP